MHWKRVAIVGVGLLGGSLGLALKQRRLAETVIGFVRRAASVRECERLGAVDRATRDLEQAVQGADLVVLCTPIAQMRSLVEQMLPALSKGAIITDVGSVKDPLVRELEPLAASAAAHFIGSHPMAGAEKMGVAAARADLFTGAACVVTPTRKSNPVALRKVERLWQSIGGRLLRLAPAAHDELVSRTSHLPHVVAAELANFVLSPEHPKEQPSLCANGFRDTTRIASGSPEMWRDIALANRGNLADALASFVANLRSFQQALEQGDEKAVSGFFETAKRRRDKWSSKGGSPTPE
ncbi:Prephenate dehydrogenase [Verrucomicrobia bacterium]|nr:Prephenate dehydrogenase [Verrucomicrobiota bacterium]